MKYIIVPMIMFVLVFGSVPNASAQTGETSYESALEEVAQVLTSISNFFSGMFAEAVGLYATVGGTSQTATVTADFGVVEYFPNLKSKIGFASNAKNSSLSLAVAGEDNKVDKIGPGMICSNIEFDLEYKHPGELNAAVTEIVDSAGNRSTVPSPSLWFKEYEKAIGNLNVTQLYQLTGAALQYQHPGFSRTAKSVHPIPTDPQGNAKFMAQWTAAANHSYPVLWSFWNEPGHTLMGIIRTRNEFGDVVYPDETPHEFDARKIRQSGSSSLAFAKLYAQHEAQIRQALSKNSQIGMASFLAADFNPYKVTLENNVYFKAVTDTLKSKYPKASIDFITFNNFNGGWPLSFSGARTVLGNRSDVGPFIVTQYSPSSLKISDSGDVTNTDVTPMQVSTEMLTNLAQVERAADVRSVCMSYWVGGKYSFLSEKTTAKGTSLTETERYKTMQLFAALPTMRTKLDFGTTGLEAKGVRGLAGVSHSKAAVLLWNESAQTITVPLTLNRVPSALTQPMQVRMISDKNTSVTVTPYTEGEALILPPYAVALVEATSATIADPLARRNSIVSGGILPTRFLQTKSITDRVPFPCTDVTKLPNIDTCSKNTGTYGFYDSVRSVAYLGRGEGSTAASVTATYESVPAKLYINPHIFAQSGLAVTPAAVPISVTATFPTCQVTVQAKMDPSKYMVLDFTSPIVNPLCRNGKTSVLTFTLPGNVPAGTQAEIYVSSNSNEASLLASNNPLVTYRATEPDVKERLVVNPSLAAIRETVTEQLVVKAVSACPRNETVCTPLPYVGDLVLIDEYDNPVVTFTPNVNGTIVEALRGKYTIMTVPAKGDTKLPALCKAIEGDIKISNETTNEVVVSCK